MTELCPVIRMVSCQAMSCEGILSVPQISTTILLTNWEKGSGDAERLCADLLRIDAFEEVDPQHALGGPDFADKLERPKLRAKLPQLS